MGIDDASGRGTPRAEASSGAGAAEQQQALFRARPTTIPHRAAPSDTRRRARTRPYPSPTRAMDMEALFAEMRKAQTGGRDFAAEAAEAAERAAAARTIRLGLGLGLGRGDAPRGMTPEEDRAAFRASEVGRAARRLAPPVPSTTPALEAADIAPSPPSRQVRSLVRPRPRRQMVEPLRILALLPPRRARRPRRRRQKPLRRSRGPGRARPAPAGRCGELRRKLVAAGATEFEAKARRWNSPAPPRKRSRRWRTRPPRGRANPSSSRTSTSTKPTEATKATAVRGARQEGEAHVRQGERGGERRAPRQAPRAAPTRTRASSAARRPAAEAAGGGVSSAEVRFREDAFCLLARYSSAQGAHYRAGAMQAALPSQCFDALRANFDVSAELFASPLNCHFRRHFSAYADVDAPFGSLGDCFKFHPTRDRSRRTRRSTPRPSPSRRAPRDAPLAKRQPLSFAVIVPHWPDASCWRKLATSAYATRT